MSEKAVVHFRVRSNGTYKHLNHKRRGYYRVLVVRDVGGSFNKNSHNVVKILYEGRCGIEGVSKRSRYYLGDEMEKAVFIAQEYNERLLTNGV